MVYVVDKSKEPVGAIYTTNTEYLNRLTSGLSDYKKKKICGELLKKWEGSCYGLSLSMILASQGNSLDGIDTPFWKSRSPVNNNLAIRNTINFYQLTQYLDEGKATEIVFKEFYLKPFSTVSLNSFLDDLISEAQKSEREKKPFLLNYSHSGLGHTVVVCGVSDQQGDIYKIRIYDPNSYKSNLSGYNVPYLSFEIDKSTHQFSFIDANEEKISNNSFHFLSITGIDSIYNTILSIGSTSNKRTMKQMAKITSADTTELIVSAYKKCKITNSNGQTLIYDGENYSGTMEVYEAKIFGEGENTELAFTVDKSDYFEIKDFDSEISLATNISDNYYMSKVKGADSVLLSKDIGIVVNSNLPYVFTSTIGTELSSCEVVSISGETTGQCQIVSNENKISFKSENDCADTLIKTMKNSEIKFEEIGDNLSSINISDSKDGQIVIDSNVQNNNAEISKKYSITMQNGTSDKTEATMGEIVTITANAAPNGQIFDYWDSDDVTFTDVSNATTTFTMPSKAVKITAIYKSNNISTDDAENGNIDSDTNDNSSNASAGNGGVVSIFGGGIATVYTATPVPSPSQTPVPVTTSTPIVTPTPVVTPEPTIVPTIRPEASTVPSAMPMPEPSAITDTETDNKTSFETNIKKGLKFTDKKTKAVYKVTNTVKNKSVEYIKSKEKNIKNVIIPSTVKFKGKTFKVVSIGKAALKNNKKLKLIKIGKNVKTIGKEAFSGCKKLNNVTMGKNITSIGASAFNKCTSLTKIIIPAKVKKIGKKAFYKCKNLQYILVKTKKLKANNIGKDAFSSGYANPRVKSNKSIWKQYQNIFTSKGLSKGALFIINPVKL